MAKNPLWELHQYGQSLWLDNIRRGLIASGELARMIEEDGIVGVTSNPTIFEKAIGGSTDYDAAMRALVDQGLNADQILEALIFEDIRLATDLLRPLYERSEGRDGFVSIEVSPHLAHDTQATTEQARRYWRAVDRPNLMVKVPATPEGLPAIQRLTAEGINVNITLLFSIERYAEVMEAYLSGLEQRIAEGQPVTHIASVASFFVSRVDTAVDRRLEALLRGVEDPLQKEQLQELLGRAAIANAKEAYQRFKRVFTSARFAALREKGARVQRPLWASTSTKNPNYRDTLYLEELIGPDTVNTLPHQTILAFKDHGVVRGVTLEDDLDTARESLDVYGPKILVCGKQKRSTSGSSPSAWVG
ncbi:MAG: transaldolase [Chloroflexi bacterium]|nr:transaldolase [Chloroflexota bacterium]